MLLFLSFNSSWIFGAFNVFVTDKSKYVLTKYLLVHKATFFKKLILVLNTEHENDFFCQMLMNDPDIWSGDNLLKTVIPFLKIVLSFGEIEPYIHCNRPKKAEFMENIAECKILIKIRILVAIMLANGFWDFVF